MRQEFKGTSAQVNCLTRIKRVMDDPTLTFVSRSCEVNQHDDDGMWWVEWRDNDELKRDIAKIIASRQPTYQGVNDTTEEIFNLIGRL